MDFHPGIYIATCVGYRKAEGLLWLLSVLLPSHRIKSNPLAFLSFCSAKTQSGNPLLKLYLSFVWNHAIVVQNLREIPEPQLFPDRFLLLFVHSHYLPAQKTALVIRLPIILTNLPWFKHFYFVFVNFRLEPVLILNTRGKQSIFRHIFWLFSVWFAELSTF